MKDFLSRTDTENQRGKNGSAERVPVKRKGVSLAETAVSARIVPQKKVLRTSDIFYIAGILSFSIRYSSLSMFMLYYCLGKPAESKEWRNEIIALPSSTVDRPATASLTYPKVLCSYSMSSLIRPSISRLVDSFIVRYCAITMDGDF